MKGIVVLVLSLSVMLFFVTDVFAQKTSVRVYEDELTGYIQHPDPIEEQENTLIVWEKPVKKIGLNRGIKVVLSQAVLDTFESRGDRLDDFQFKKVTILGIFQKFSDGTIYCIEILNLVDYELLSEAALEAEKRLEQLAFSAEGYLELGQGSILVYKKPAGEEFVEEIKFDDKTLFLNTPLGWPREYLHTLFLENRVRVKVGWRKPESAQVINGNKPDEYIADYINITVLK